jgi:RNA 3'-terminal phosphate cyclase (ATP)
MDSLEINGSFGEGGGQILRTSLTFSAITGRPIQIHSVRGGRAKPGLQPQHLAAVHAAQSICDAEVKGDAVGSMFLSFRPTRSVEPGRFEFDIGTAGSTCLVLQTVFPALALLGAPSMVTVKGGTHNPKAPTVDYLTQVFEPTISHFGWHLDIACETPGFYPRGGGRIDATIRPADPRPIELAGFPEEHRLTVVIHSSMDRDDLFARTHNAIGGHHKDDSAPLQFVDLMKPGPSPGIGLTLVAANGFHRAGFTALGERRKSMEAVCEEAYAEYASWRGDPPGLDEHLADQLVPLAALTQGQNEWRTHRPSEHLRTVLQLVEWFDMGSTLLDEETGLVRVSR